MIDRELYVPRSWTDDPERCAAAGIPTEVEFATKPALAAAMLTRAVEAEVTAEWVTGDEVYGADPVLRAHIEALGLGYVLAIGCDRRVSTHGGLMRPDQIAAALPERCWQRYSAGAGAKGPRIYEWAWITLTEVEDASAAVVRRIFDEYLDGHGDRAIAHGLNRDRIPCPSARRPDQNRHRLADGWQASTVKAILGNPRYTGYAFFGRWTKHETLLDPDDVAAGHVVRFRRSSADRVVRSREQAHPAIVSVETFTQAQLRRRSRSAGGIRNLGKLERTRTTGTRPYLLRGLVRCGLCGRRMQGAVIRKRETYYRCLARTLAPGSAALAGHPRTVNLREFDVVEPLNAWIGFLFSKGNVERTVAALVASQDGDAKPSAHEAARKRFADAESRLKRFQDAIAAGIDPSALVDAINEAQAQRAAARAELDGAPAPSLITDAEVYAMIDSLGDVGSALKDAEPGSLERLYRELGLGLRYEPQERAVDVLLAPRVVNGRVRGGNRTRKRSTPAQCRCPYA
jgi:hypothetical protein